MRLPRPKPPELRGILFDWDGTLVNSAEASFRCYVRLFGSFGIPFDRPSFERTYSPNWYRTYVEVGLPENRWAEADALWLSYYAEEENHLIPGAREALDRVVESGLLRGLVTSGDRDRVERELRRLGVSSVFHTVVCSEDAQEKKPHPEALLLALSRLGLGPGQTAYVGDSPEDVAMARAAGAYSVGIPGGFPNRRGLEASEPDALVPDLPSAIDILLGGPPPSRLGGGGSPRFVGRDVE